MPRKVKTAFTGSDTDRALTGIHDIAFIARERDGVQGLRDPRRRRHVDHAARRADARRLRHRRGRRVPQVGRGRLPHLRPPGLAARQPRPRPHQGARRQDRHRGDARAGRRGAAGRLGRRARLLDRRSACSCTTRRRTRPRRRSPTARRTATAPSSSASHAANVEAQRQDGFSAVQVKVTRGDLTPEQFRGLAAIMRDYCGGYARTTVHQNLVLRWVRDEAVYDVWTPAARARARRRAAPTRSTTSSRAPAPTPASSASRARWGSTARSRSGSSRWRSPTR